MNAYIFFVLFGLAAASTITRPSSQKISVFEVPEPSAKEPIGIAGIKELPMIALIKARNGLVAYLLENGLKTLATDPSPTVRHLNEVLKANKETTALIFNASTLATEKAPTWQNIRDLNIISFEAPENTRVSSVAKSSLRKMPIVMLFERADFASHKYQDINNRGEIDLAVFTETN